MDRDSILGDLKKYANRDWAAAAQKITGDTALQNQPSTPHNNDVPATPRSVVPRPASPPVVLAATPRNNLPPVRVERPTRPHMRQPEPRAVPTIRIEEIAALIHPPFEIVLQNGQISPDNATIRVKCQKRHEHDYFIRDIIDAGVTCKTCSFASKYAAVVRETAESVLGVPFTIMDGAKGNTCEFTNVEHSIIIVCNAKPGMDTKRVEAAAKREQPYHGIKFKLPFSTSTSRLKRLIVGHLTDENGKLTPELRARVEQAIPPVRPSAREFMQRFRRELLPHTAETANMVIRAQRLSNPFLAKMNMSIVDSEKLCMENCTEKN